LKLLLLHAGTKERCLPEFIHFANHRSTTLPSSKSIFIQEQQPNIVIIQANFRSSSPSQKSCPITGLNGRAANASTGMNTKHLSNVRNVRTHIAMTAPRRLWSQHQARATRGPVKMTVPLPVRISKLFSRFNPSQSSPDAENISASENRFCRRAEIQQPAIGLIKM